MANVMSMKKLRNNPGYNGFDLSRKNLFTAKVGELLPVCCIECLPDDKYTLKHQHFTRTRPIMSPAYTRIREYYDWFFVPTNLLWNKFNTFVTQMGNNAQHANGILDTAQIGSRHPYFTNTQVVNYLKLMQLQSTDTENAFGFNRGQNTAKLLDYLGYGTFYNVAETSPTTGDRIKYLVNANLNPFPLLAYQKIYSDYFRNSQWENSYAPAFNIDYAQSGQQLPLSDLTSATGVDNMFDLRYCNWNQDYFMGLKPNSQYGAAASINIQGQNSINSGVTTDTDGFYLFNNAATTDTNVKVVSSSGMPTPAGANSRLYVPDSNSGNAFRFYLDSEGVSMLREAFNLSGSGTINSAFTILALRQAQAKQRWAEITQSVGQDYKSQVEAHWGKEVSDAYSEKCMWIGGQSSSLDIQGVDNTNLTGDSSQVNIKGKGIGTGQSSEKFTAPCHGILMCIYHAVPVLDYMLTGVEKFNLKTLATDYAIPEMDKTGMVSVPIVELINGIDTLENSGTIPTNLYNTLLGYAPLYYEYKTAYDTVKGGFRFDTEYRSWVAPVTNQYLTSYMLANQAGGTSKLNYYFFKVNPAIMNRILDADAGSGVINDQLFVNLFIDIKASRKLDYNGLPM